MFCKSCGKEMVEGSAFCPSCGSAQNDVPVKAAPKSAAVTCPLCGSDHVVVQREQVKAKTRHRGRGILWGIMRFLLIICTCGLWLLIGRSKGKSKTKFKSETVAVCQSCGNSWKMSKAEIAARAINNRT